MRRFSAEEFSQAKVDNRCDAWEPHAKPRRPCDKVLRGLPGALEISLNALKRKSNARYFSILINIQNTYARHYRVLLPRRPGVAVYLALTSELTPPFLEPPASQQEKRDAPRTLGCTLLGQGNHNIKLEY